MKTRLTIVMVVIAIFAVILISGCSKEITIKAPTPESPITLPNDEAAHFDSQVEWWYYTGHLATEDGENYGFELVFAKAFVGEEKVGFIPLRWISNFAYEVDFAIIDPNNNRFLYEIKQRLWGAGASEKQFKVWNGASQAEGGNGSYTLRALMPRCALALNLRSNKRAVIHNENGIVDMGGFPMYYYSYTRLEGDGFLTIDGIKKKVTALAWYDHQWGMFSDHARWDWFSVQLDDKTELMLIMFGTKNKLNQIGAIIFQDGSVEYLSKNDFEIIALDKWVSPHTKAEYPMGWKVILPQKSIELELHPELKDAELYGGIASSETIYWEGSVIVGGTKNNKPIRGVGYVELVGYVQN